MKNIQNAKLRKAIRTDKADNGEYEVRTTLLSRNITISGRRTSVRLEPEMWLSLYDIAKREHCSIHDICSLISLRKNPKTSLTAAIRVFLMLYFRAAATEDGHVMAGHGSFEYMKSRAGLAEKTVKKTINADDAMRVSSYIRRG